MSPLNAVQSAKNGTMGEAPLASDAILHQVETGKGIEQRQPDQNVLFDYQRKQAEALVFSAGNVQEQLDMSRLRSLIMQTEKASQTIQNDSLAQTAQRVVLGSSHATEKSQMGEHHEPVFLSLLKSIFSQKKIDEADTWSQMSKGKKKKARSAIGWDQLGLGSPDNPILYAIGA